MEVKGWKAIKGESLRQKFRGAHGEMRQHTYTYHINEIQLT